MRLRPADSSGSQGASSSGAAAAAASTADSGRGALALARSASSHLAARAYVPVKTLPLIFAQRKRHLQQHKSRQAHAEPYQQRDGEGLLSLPEDVLVRGRRPALRRSPALQRRLAAASGVAPWHVLLLLLLRCCEAPSCAPALLLHPPP